MIKGDSTILTLEVMKQCRPALVQTGKCQHIHANFFAIFKKYASCDCNLLLKLHKNLPYLTLDENVTDSTEFEVEPVNKNE